MIKIAICDDQLIIVQQLEKALTQYLSDRGETFQIQTFLDGNELIGSENDYDLILLDMEMPTLDGLSTAKYLRSRQIDSLIVFVTSHAQTVYDAFEVKAFRFLVKPLQTAQLEKMLSEALLEIKEREKEYLSVELSGTKMIQIPLRDLLYIESNGRYANFHLKGETFTSIMTLKDLEKTLPQGVFFRCHTSFIVNLRHVLRLEGQDIHLTNGQIIFLTRLKNRTFKEAFHRILKEK